jgi:hypothetical protein
MEDPIQKSYIRNEEDDATRMTDPAAFFVGIDGYNGDAGSLYVHYTAELFEPSFGADINPPNICLVQITGDQTFSDGTMANLSPFNVTENTAQKMFTVNADNLVTKLAGWYRIATTLVAEDNTNEDFKIYQFLKVDGATVEDSKEGSSGGAANTIENGLNWVGFLDAGAILTLAATMYGALGVMKVLYGYTTIYVHKLAGQPAN